MCVLFLLQILDLICVVCMMENSNNELAEILISKLRLAIETARHLINHRLDKCQRKYLLQRFDKCQRKMIELEINDTAVAALQLKIF